MKFRLRYLRVHEMMIDDENIEAAQRRGRAMEAMWPLGEMKLLGIYPDGAIIPPTPPLTPKPKLGMQKPNPGTWVNPWGWEPKR